MHTEGAKTDAAVGADGEVGSLQAMSVPSVQQRERLVSFVVTASIIETVAAVEPAKPTTPITGRDHLRREHACPAAETTEGGFVARAKRPCRPMGTRCAEPTLWNRLV